MPLKWPSASQSSISDDNLPIGIILAYTGLLSNIPNGWQLCDGTGGTPDLRGRFLQGSETSVGQYISAGLPNLIGEFDAGELTYGAWQAYTSGVFYAYHGNRYNHTANGQPGLYHILGFDASRCNHIYGNSDTVQPASYTVYYIMKIK